MRPIARYHGMALLVASLAGGSARAQAPKSGALFDSLTIGENVLFSLELREDYDQQNKDDVVNGLLQMVDILEYKDAYPSDLSTGYKRAVAIARALAAQPQCILYGLIRAGVKRSVWHVRDQQSPLHRTANGLNMREHFIQSHRHRVAVAQHDIAQTVANQNDINTSLVHQAGCRIVIGRQTDKTFASFFAGA